mmetsp:Transcript_33609/g.66919  ORF Transcript_33609/g.66919 Transcript_33609/m.66919 type:complete len:116 (-) Transcript_33609:71-418(-)
MPRRAKRATSRAELAEVHACAMYELCMCMHVPQRRARSRDELTEVHACATEAPACCIRPPQCRSSFGSKVYGAMHHDMHMYRQSVMRMATCMVDVGLHGQQDKKGEGFLGGDGCS